MHFLIDGYNVTKRDPATSGLEIAAQRDALERRLRVRARRMLGSTSYTIVWDGAGGEGVVHGTDAHVAFTRRPTADDAIVERVRRARERVGVVTSDRELAERCRAAASFGVDVLPSERLFEHAGDPAATDAGAGKGAAAARSKKRTGKGAPLRRDVGIPANANEINRELKKIWGIED